MTTVVRDVPSNRPCAACHKGRSEYKSFNFADGVKCICTTCSKLGFTFTPLGHVLDPRGRVVGVQV